MHVVTVTCPVEIIKESWMLPTNMSYSSTLQFASQLGREMVGGRIQLKIFSWTFLSRCNDLSVLAFSLHRVLNKKRVRKTPFTMFLFSFAHWPLVIRCILKYIDYTATSLQKELN